MSHLNLNNVICDAIVNGLDGVEDDLIEQLISIATHMKDLLDVLVHFTLPFFRNRKESLNVSFGGQSIVCVEQNQLLYLRELNFTWSSITQIFGVSRSLLYRVRKEVELQSLPKYSCISDEDLWDVVGLNKTNARCLGEDVERCIRVTLLY